MESKLLNINELVENLLEIKKIYNLEWDHYAAINQVIGILLTSSAPNIESYYELP